MIVASLLGQIFSPIFHAMSWLLAFYYGLVHNYVIAIMLLTFTVMILSFPLNRASTRSMFKMQLLGPEMQKIKSKYKATRDMSALERQEMRQKMNEETMALYRENNVSMLGGCLPNLAVFPIFIVLYDVVRGLTNTCPAAVGSSTCATATQLKSLQHTVPLWAPRYAYYTNTDLYRNLKASNGQMRSFGINLADTVRTSQSHWYMVLPFVTFVLIAVALQYLQLRQMTRRNTSTAPAAQQMQTMQRIMPVVMAAIYISIPAAVNVYFVASSLFRIGQQEWMYRRDPQITKAVEELKKRKANPGAKSSPAKGAQSPELGRARPQSFRERLAAAIAPADDGAASDDQKPAATTGDATRAARTGSGGQRPAGKTPQSSKSRPNQSKAATGRTSSGGTSSGGASSGGASPASTDKQTKPKPAGQARSNGGTTPKSSQSTPRPGKPANGSSPRSPGEIRGSGAASRKPAPNGTASASSENGSNGTNGNGSRPRKEKGPEAAEDSAQASTNGQAERKRQRRNG